MTERSLFWQTQPAPQPNDGSADYNQSRLRQWQDKLNGQGVLSVGGELAPTSPAVDTIRVDSGAAYVNGFFYENTTFVDVPFTRPTLGDTGGRVVLEANWQGVGGPAKEVTVRAFVALSPDGNPAIPLTPPTQISGTTYQISLGTFVADIAGIVYTDASKSVTGVNDNRSFALSANAGMVRIGRFAPTALAPAVTFNNIQGNFSHLMIAGNVLLSAGAAGTALTMSFNNDTLSGNYDVHRLNAIGVTPGAVQDVATNQASLGVASRNKLVAGQRDSLVVNIQNYASTGYTRTFQSKLGALTDGVSFDISTSHGQWRNTVAGITSILILAAPATFDVGTDLSLYGIR